MARLTLFTWLLCSFLGTLLLFVGYSMLASERFSGSDSLLVAGVAFAVSLVVFLPAMIGFGYLAAALYPRNTRVQAKLITSLYAVAATFATFFIGLKALGMRSGEMHEAYYFALPYAAAFVLSICLLKWPGQQAPDTLWGDALLDPERPQEVRPAPFPANAYFAVIAILGLSLLISVFQVLQSWGQYTMMPHALWTWLGSLALFVAGLILFCLRRSVGWVLLAIICTANITGQLYSFLHDISFFLHAGIQSFLVLLAAFFVMDVAVLTLLLQPRLRRAYRITDQQTWLWVVCGLVFGAVRLVLFRLV